MTEQKEPVPIGENWLSSYPPRQHHQTNNHGNQQERVGRFPNQYFANVHCGLKKRELRSRATRRLTRLELQSRNLPVAYPGIHHWDGENPRRDRAMPIPLRFKTRSAEIDRHFPKSLYMTVCRDALVLRVRYGNGRMSPMGEGFQNGHGAPAFTAPAAP